MHDGKTIHQQPNGKTPTKVLVEGRMKDWLARLLSEIRSDLGIDCLRVAVVLAPKQTADVPLHLSLPTDLAARPETEVARTEALRTGRVALAGAVPGKDIGGRPSCIVIPIEADAGWVEVEAFITSDERAGAIIERVELAAGWALFLGSVARDEATVEAEARAVSALKSIVSFSGSASFSEAARALVTDICGRFACDRVALGLSRRRSVRVVAISNTGRFSRSMLLVRLLRAAMEEAVDQEQVLLWPPHSEGSDRITHAQEELAERNTNRSILTIPLVDGKRQQGALILERGAGLGFEPNEIETLEALAGVLAPLVIEKRDNDRWLPARAMFAMRNVLTEVFGRRYFAIKLTVVAALASVASLILIERPLTIVGDAVVEGAEQRTITVAFDGFIASASVREGDRVKSGDQLLQLDDRDFTLERLRLMTLRAQAELELDRAIAARERVETGIVEARLRQIDAELTLAEQQIKRSRVNAPFDALVISGDLSRSVGRAVSRGETLMVISPLNDYRVFLNVAEADITHLQPGQFGLLKLSAIPEKEFNVELVDVVPVARYENNSTHFAVEARLLEHYDILLHGMSGAARVEVDQVTLLELWGKPLWDIVRLWLWRNVQI
jgi:hypothetical protein